MTMKVSLIKSHGISFVKAHGVINFVGGDHPDTSQEE